MSKNAKDNVKGLISSLGEINKLALGEIEKLCEMQRDALAFYQDASMQQLRAIAEIDGTEGLKNAVTSVVHTAGDIARRNMEDYKALMSRSSEFREAVTGVVRSSKK